MKRHIMAIAALFPLILVAVPSSAAPLSGFISELFTSATVCSHCHNGLADCAGSDVSIVDDWSTSMMAFSFIDPFWQAKVASEVARAPALREVIMEKCSRCHAPMAHTLTGSDGGRSGGETRNYFRQGNLYHAAAVEGVGCTLCHQIADSAILGTEASYTGNYAPALSSGRIYGQYSGVLTGPMMRMTGYEPLYGVQIHRSRICGVCHNLKTPFVDRAGRLASTPATEFPEQAVYTEWEQSDYSDKGATPTSCQECHMPSTDGVVLASRPPWLDTPRDRFSRHTFFGANTLIRDLILRNGLADGTPANRLRENLGGVRRFLSAAAAVSVVESSLSEGTLTARVSVQNRTGHKLPTGFPSRRLVLHYTVKDEQGRVVFESGKSGDDTSRITGVDADRDGLRFEPHHDVITSPEQVQVYEGIMGDTEGNVTYTLLRGSRFLKDNRLLPAGFSKEKAPAEVRPTPDALADPNFGESQDLVTFVTIGLPGKRYTVSAELVYQTIGYRFLENLYEERSLPAVAALRSELEDAYLRQETIARAERLVAASGQQ